MKITIQIEGGIPQTFEYFTAAESVASLNSEVIILEEKRLLLSPKICDALTAKPEDRILVKYITDKKTNITYPVIGKQEMFGTKNGNRLTKQLTIAFSGSKRDALLPYGEKFKLLPLKGSPGVFKMVEPSVEIPEDLEEVAEERQEEVLEIQNNSQEGSKYFDTSEEDSRSNIDKKSDEEENFEDLWGDFDEDWDQDEDNNEEPDFELTNFDFDV